MAYGEGDTTRYLLVTLYLKSGDKIQFKTSRFQELVQTEVQEIDGKEVNVAVPGTEYFSWAKRENDDSPVYIDRSFVAVAMTKPVVEKKSAKELGSEGS